ncbi:MAG: hypothetical protein M0P49_06880 [Bacilli bacterium]|nr:hypothetical protein [Bacilli bacterium]
MENMNNNSKCCHFGRVSEEVECDRYDENNCSTSCSYDSDISIVIPKIKDTKFTAVSNACVELSHTLERPKESTTVFENWKEYDDKGNLIHFKTSDGFEYWNEYDEGNLIHFKTNDGYESWSEYNNRKLIHFRDSNGKENWKEYDDKGNLIHFKDATGCEYWQEFDDEGNMIHRIFINSYESWYEYDKGNLIHFKDSNGNEEINEYDDKGNVIYSKKLNNKVDKNEDTELK